MPHLEHFGLSNKLPKDIPIYMGRAAVELICFTDQFTLLSFLSSLWASHGGLPGRWYYGPDLLGCRPPRSRKGRDHSPGWETMHRRRQRPGSPPVGDQTGWRVACPYPRFYRVGNSVKIGTHPIFWNLRKAFCVRKPPLTVSFNLI